MKNRDKLIRTLKTLISRSDNNIYDVLLKHIVQEGKMTSQEVTSILTLQKKLDDVDTTVLVWFYQALSEYKRLPDIHSYFYDNEISQASFYIDKRRRNAFPLRFKILSKLSLKDEYLICLSIKDVIELNHGIIQLIPDMQRESTVVNFNGKLLSHIKFSDTRAREIGQCILNGSYWSNMIRWHLVLDGNEDYDVSDDYIVINQGLIANIDGQHRNAGFEYCLAENNDINMMIPIVLTIGTTRDAQSIINQEEKREPLAQTHVKSFANTTSNQIVKSIKSNEDIHDTYKFITTFEQYDGKMGFVLESLLSDAIDDFYDVNSNNDMTLKDRKKLESWLIEFFIELDDCLHSEFQNFETEKQWYAHPYAFYGYIYLSSIFRDTPDYGTLLRSAISRIDFVQKPWGKALNPPVIKQRIVQVFKEAVMV